MGMVLPQRISTDTSPKLKQQLTTYMRFAIMNTGPPGIDEIIYYSNNMIREGTRSNILHGNKRRLNQYKNENSRSGITRSIILNDLVLSTKPQSTRLHCPGTTKATEVFITATGKEIMPVTKIGRHARRERRSGQQKKEVMTKFKNFFESYNHIVWSCCINHSARPTLFFRKRA